MLAGVLVHPGDHVRCERTEFEGRPHLHMVAPDWEEVAPAIDSWLDGVLDAPITETEETPA